MKERELEELFRDAADTAPPSTFDVHDIERGARRVTARRRMAAAGGSLVAAGVLVAGVGAGTGAFTSDVNTQAGPSRPAAGPEAPRGGDYSGPKVLTLPGGGQSGCGQPDPELASALNARLPAVSESSTPMPATDCPSGARSASFQLRGEDAAGRVTVILSPAGSVEAGKAAPGTSRLPGGTVQAVSKADSGRVVIVRSKPSPGSPAPYGDELAGIANSLADRF